MSMNHGKHLLKMQKAKHTGDLFHLLRPSRAYMGLFRNPRHQQDSRVQLAVKAIRFRSSCSYEGFDKMKH